MADIKHPEPPMAPDLSHLITEDDEPVDNRFSERQQRLLPHILFTSWEEGRPFEALADVGLFPTPTNEDKVVPDFLLSLGVVPRPATGAKENRSYLVWVYGKAPDLVIEVVSNKVGGELGEKLEKYTRIRVTYYAIYDPFCELGERELRLFRLDGGRYVEMANPRWLPEVGLGLTIWEGEFEGVQSRWLRFLDREGRMLATGEEKARSAEKALANSQLASAASGKFVPTFSGEISFTEKRGNTCLSYGAAQWAVPRHISRSTGRSDESLSGCTVPIRLSAEWC